MAPITHRFGNIEVADHGFDRRYFVNGVQVAHALTRLAEEGKKTVTGVNVHDSRHYDAVHAIEGKFAGAGAARTAKLPKA